MNHRDYVLAAINHEETDRVPYTLGFEGGTDVELDQYYGSTEWRSRIQQCMRHVGGVDSIVERRIDDVYVKDAFGSLWRMDKLPFHLEKPALPEHSFEGAAWPTIDQFPVWVADDIDVVTGPNAQQFTIVDNGWGIFEHAWRIRGFENLLIDCVEEEDFFEELLDRLTELRLGMVEKCRNIPADAILFGDDWGDQRGVIIGPERWRRFIKPRWAKVYEAAHEQGKYVISHCCGSVADIMPDIIEIGLDVLESVQPEPAGMNPFELKRKYGDKIMFWGCLGSQSTIPFGTPEEIGRQVDALCREMSKGGGFILAPAKWIQPGAPVENMAAVVEAFTPQNL